MNQLLIFEVLQETYSLARLIALYLGGKFFVSWAL